MEILHINDHKVKITLAKAEIDRLALSGKRVEEWGDVRGKLGEILEGSTLSCDFLKGRILVQAYPMRDGGCELFVTRLSDREECVGGTPHRSDRVRSAVSNRSRSGRGGREEKTDGKSNPSHTEEGTRSFYRDRSGSVGGAGDSPGRTGGTYPLLVFRFASRDDLLTAEALFQDRMKGCEIYRIEGERYVLVTHSRGYVTDSGEGGVRMHPFCEFAEPLPVSVLDCLDEHGTPVSWESILAAENYL